MNTSSLIAAAVAATTILGACAGAPTGPESAPVAPSFAVSNSMGDWWTVVSVDAEPVAEPVATVDACPLETFDTTMGFMAGDMGTYAVAYGELPVVMTDCGYNH